MVESRHDMGGKRDPGEGNRMRRGADRHRRYDYETDQALGSYGSGYTTGANFDDSYGAYGRRDDYESDYGDGADDHGYGGGSYARGDYGPPNPAAYDTGYGYPGSFDVSHGDSGRRGDGYLYPAPTPERWRAMEPPYGREYRGDDARRGYNGREPARGGRRDEFGYDPRYGTPRTGARWGTFATDYDWPRDFRTPFANREPRREGPRRAAEPGFSPDERRQGTYAGKGPKGYEKSDERIHEQVCEVLTDDDRLDARNIDVQVQGGVVTLTGSVDSRFAKRRAQDFADEIVGVKDTVNELKIAEHLSEPENAAPAASAADTVDAAGSGTKSVDGAPPSPGASAPNMQSQLVGDEAK